MPLGGLRVSGNKIDCECSSVVDLVEFLDYDQPETNLGEFVLKNEFYSTSYCKEASNSDKTLMDQTGPGMNFLDISRAQNDCLVVGYLHNKDFQLAGCHTLDVST